MCKHASKQLASLHVCKIQKITLSFNSKWIPDYLIRIQKPLPWFSMTPSDFAFVLAQLSRYWSSVLLPIRKRFLCSTDKPSSFTTHSSMVLKWAWPLFALKQSSVGSISSEILGKPLITLFIQTILLEIPWYLQMPERIVTALAYS